MIIGLTGGIGSGKSTVAKIFQEVGIPIYDADTHSKNIIDTYQSLQDSLKQLLGKDIVVDGKIDRPKMANLIFNDTELLEQTNALIHPAVALDFSNWVKEQDSKYIIKEAAILFESGSFKNCDKIITVTAPEKMRIERVMLRNKISEKEVIDRIKKQWPEKDKADLSDFVIRNDNSESVIKQVLKIHEELSK